MTPPGILQTARLHLRELAPGDDAFILELLNEPDFIRFIGDRGVRTLEDARGYVTRAQAGYTLNGFGLWLVERKEPLQPIGICGLVRREALDAVDIGYALLERHRGQGFAFEAADAVRNHAVRNLGLTRLLGITNRDNLASIRLLEKLGLRFERLVSLNPGTPELNLYAANFPPPVTDC